MKPQGETVEKQCIAGSEEAERGRERQRGETTRGDGRKAVHCWIRRSRERERETER